MTSPLTELLPGPELASVLAEWAAAGLDPAGEVEDADPARAVDAVIACERLASWVAATQLRAMRTVAAAGAAAARPGSPGARVGMGEFAAAEIGCALRIAPRTAQRRLDLAWTLTERLPRTLEALSAGRVTVAKAAVLAEETGSLAEEDVAAVEAAVLDDAAQRTPGELRRRVRRAVLATDPGAARRRTERAAAEADVRVMPAEDGMAGLWAQLPAEQAAVVWAVVDTAARSGSPVDRRPIGVRRAAALVDLVTGRPGVDVHVEIQAITSLGALTDTGTASPSASVAEIAPVGPVPAAAVRDLLARHRASLRLLAVDPSTGRLVAAGATTYRIPAAMDRHVRLRDRTCRFPGCLQPARRADIDHQVPWPHGPTHPANLAVLCRHHHRLKTHGGWQVEHRPDDDTLIWTSPTGHTYLTRTYPYADPPDADETGTLAA